MNASKIEAIARNNGGKVVLSTEEKVIVKDKNGVNHTFVTERYGGRTTEPELLLKLGVKEKQSKLMGMKVVHRRKAKKSKPTPPGGEKFAVKLEKIKGVGMSSAIIISKNYNMKSLVSALKKKEDIGVSKSVISSLNKALV